MVSSFWKQRNVFITGCTGFVGRHLVNECCRLGANVTGLSRTSSKVAGINLVYGSLDNVQVLQKALEDNQIDTVFHLAAQAVEGVANENPLATFETNIRGTWNLLEACRQTSIKRVIVTSSEKAYGELSPPPYVETIPVQGRLPYDVSKSCADLITHTYYHAYGLPVCIIRCGIIFGGGDLNFSRLIPHTIQSILENKAPVILSDGTNIRDFIYIEDAVKAHLLAAEKLESSRLAGEAFNFSNETPKTIAEVVEQIINLTNSDVKPIIQNTVSDKNKQHFLSAKKARELLEWQPTYNFESGLAKTIDWYREYFKRQ